MYMHDPLYGDIYDMINGHILLDATGLYTRKQATYLVLTIQILITIHLPIYVQYNCGMLYVYANCTRKLRNYVYT